VYEVKIFLICSCQSSEVGIPGNSVGARVLVIPSINSWLLVDTAVWHFLGISEKNISILMNGHCGDDGHRCKPRRLLSLATWLGLGHFGGLFWPTPWDVDVEGIRFCWSVARRAEPKQNRTPGLSPSPSSAGFSGSGTTLSLSR
jgi:hypothetical protein